MVLAVSGTTRYSVWLKLASVFTPALRSGTLFLGSIPLKYSRISVLSAPYSREDRVMPAEKRAGGGSKAVPRTDFCVDFNTGQTLDCNIQEHLRQRVH